MMLHVPRLAVGLDPLMAEAKRRAQRRRVLAALGVVLLTGLAAGLVFAFRSPGAAQAAGCQRRATPSRVPT